MKPSLASYIRPAWSLVSSVIQRLSLWAYVLKHGERGNRTPCAGALPRTWTTDVTTEKEGAKPDCGNPRRRARSRDWTTSQWATMWDRFTAPGDPLHSNMSTHFRIPCQLVHILARLIVSYRASLVIAHLVCPLSNPLGRNGFTLGSDTDLSLV